MEFVKFPLVVFQQHKLFVQQIQMDLVTGIIVIVIRIQLQLVLVITINQIVVEKYLEQQLVIGMELNV
jgi:hypothetical protein